MRIGTYDQKAKKRNTLLVRLALWTMVVALFSVMMVGVSGYLNLESEIQENARYYYQQRFDYTCNLLEQQVFSPAIMLQQEAIVLDDWTDDMRMLSGAIHTQNVIIEMKTLLNQRMQVNSAIADIAVYSSNNNFVISGRSGVRFLANIAADTPFDREWIRQVEGMGNTSSIRWLSQRPYPENLGVEGNVISLVYYANYGIKDTRKMYLCLSISCNELMDRVELEGGESLFMVNMRGETVLGEHILPEGIPIKNGTYHQGGSIYLIRNSENTPWKYVLCVPAAEYMRHGNILRSRIIAVSVGVFLIMTLFSFVVIGRMTSPFSAMLERARSLRAEKYDRRRGDMRFVADTFDEYVDYAEAGQRQLDERMELLRHSFLLSLLLGRPLHEQDMVSCMQLMRVENPHQGYHAIVLRRASGEFSPQEEQRIESMLTEYSHDEISFFSAGAYGNLMYAVANADSIEEVRSQIDDMLGSLSRMEGAIRLHAWVGEAVEQLENVSESYKGLHELLAADNAFEMETFDDPDTDGAEVSSAGQYDNCAQGAAEYLQQHYSEDIAVQDIADSLNVSRSHLSRVFKVEHGMTILEFLMGVRLSNAMRLLDETNLSVTEISEMTGFNNSNYFFKKFKEKFGQTPMQYRSEEK